MAIGRISGSVLKSNLTRNGTDLAFETNLLYLDVTNSRIGIGTSSPSTALDVSGTVNSTAVTTGTLTSSGTGTSALVTLTTTEASNSASPILALKRNSSSPVTNDKLGEIQFLGENVADEEVVYGTITSKIFNTTNGSEAGKMQVQVMSSGTLTNSMRFEPDGIFLNTSNTIIFEGATADNYETTLTVVDPTADRTLSLPNVTGTLWATSTTFTLPTSDGSSGQFLKTDGSGTITFGDVEKSSTDHIVTASGTATEIGTSATNIDTFTTGTFDSAFYIAVTRDAINNEVATAQISLVHNDTTAFVASGALIQSGTETQMTYTADINSGSARLRGTGTSTSNSIKFYRIGLGDDTTASSTGKTATVLNSDVDSALEDIDTWAYASYRGAKYYISANNSNKTELQNIECMVVHNGTTAFITTYNNVYTGNNPLITLEANIGGDNVRLRASGNEPNTAVKMYRVLLGDSESAAVGTNSNIIAATTVSSSATTLDKFSTDQYTGAHYVVVGYNSGESGTPASISEVFVVSDGSGAYVGNSQISTKGTDQLTFTAAFNSGEVTLSAASTSGSSTTINAYRVHLFNKAFASGLTVPTGGNLKFADNAYARFGDGNDLSIYHNGNNSFISDQQPGGIYVLTNDFLVKNPANNETMLRASENGDVELYYNNSEKLVTTTSGITISGAIAMSVGSDPSTLADHAHIYAKDDTSSAEVYVRDEAGNVTKLSPHNEKGEWEYYSKNTKTGKVVRVNMEEMVRDIEKLTGKTYIKEE